ncbi:hypothetical protein ACJDU8_09950 [Clostridium sp. WILCCON 0269]|uniref:PRC-barrel domain-containing protein n=1 Tax=Candidatus Clostridium eludens TaxID=3381663 RepID=A0ABW8SIM8_9CLOT
MKKTGNNIDDLMQLALYMIPKYMKRIDRHNRRHSKNLEHDKEYHERQYIDSKDLIRFIEKNIFEKDGILLGKKDKDKLKETNKISDDNVSGEVKSQKQEEKSKEPEDKKEEDSKKEPENKKEEDSAKEPENKKEEDSAKEPENKIEEDSKKEPDNEKEEDSKKELDNKKEDSKKESDDKEEKQIKKIDGAVKRKYNLLSSSKCFSTCNRGVSNLLNKLVGEKLDICVKDDKMSTLNGVNLVHSDEILIKLSNESGEIIVIPVKNIVGLQSEKLSSDDKNLEQVHKRAYCTVEKRMEDYFNSIIGKKVIIQTGGQGKFGYIYNKTITKVGVGFIIIDNNMMVTFQSIVLVRELESDQRKDIEYPEL